MDSDVFDVLVSNALTAPHGDRERTSERLLPGTSKPQARSVPFPPMRANPISRLFRQAIISRHTRTPPDPAGSKSVAEYERRKAALRAATNKRHETTT